MTKGDLSDIILKTINIFDFLQYIDEGYENQNQMFVKVVDQYYKDRYNIELINHKGLINFAQLKTTLSMLVITVCFASQATDDQWREIGFNFKKEYDIEFKFKGKQKEEPSISEIIKTMRHASAHLPDNLWIRSGSDNVKSNIHFDKCCVCFTSYSKNSKKDENARVTFKSENGFLKFLSDYIKSIKKLTKLFEDEFDNMSNISRSIN